jgi:hypothetical protein
MASVGYNIAKTKMGTKLFDPVNDTVKVMALTGSSTTPDDPDHTFVSDVVADEMSDPSYSRITVGTKTGNQNDTSNKWELDSADWSFGNLNNETVLYLVTYVEVTNDADSWLLSCHDVSDIATDGTGYSGIIGANGFINIA